VHTDSPDTKRPATTLVPITTLDELEAALGLSWTQPVLIFKHSTTCGTSAYAYEELDEWLSTPGATTAAAFIVDVGAHRSVARAVTERLGVRHESPQALLIVDGTVRWHGSHWNVSADRIRQAIDQVRSG
jgi:bacillithiol system protein YtxJ